MADDTTAAPAAPDAFAKPVTPKPAPAAASTPADDGKPKTTTTKPTELKSSGVPRARLLGWIVPVLGVVAGVAMYQQSPILAAVLFGLAFIVCAGVLTAKLMRGRGSAGRAGGRMGTRVTSRAPGAPRRALLPSRRGSAPPIARPGAAPGRAVSRGAGPAATTRRPGGGPPGGGTRRSAASSGGAPGSSSSSTKPSGSKWNPRNWGRKNHASTSGGSGAHPARSAAGSPGSSSSTTGRPGTTPSARHNATTPPRGGARRPGTTAAAGARPAGGSTAATRNATGSPAGSTGSRAGTGKNGYLAHRNQNRAAGQQERHNETLINPSVAPKPETKAARQARQSKEATSRPVGRRWRGSAAPGDGIVAGKPVANKPEPPKTSTAPKGASRSTHPDNCNKVPLAHRCVRCNPRYGDPNQAWETYKNQQKTGATGSGLSRRRRDRRARNTPTANPQPAVVDEVAAKRREKEEVDRWLRDNPVDEGGNLLVERPAAPPKASKPAPKAKPADMDELAVQIRAVGMKGTEEMVDTSKYTQMVDSSTPHSYRTSLNHAGDVAEVDAGKLANEAEDMRRDAAGMTDKPALATARANLLREAAARDETAASRRGMAAAFREKASSVAV